MKPMLAILVTLSFLMWGCEKSKVADMAQLDNTIQQELPHGTSKRAVLSFLEQHKIPYDDSNNISYYRGPGKVWGKLSQSRGLTVTDYILTFEFDEKATLVSYKMDKRPVGP